MLRFLTVVKIDHAFRAATQYTKRSHFHIGHTTPTEAFSWQSARRTATMAPPAAIEVLAESDTSTFTVPDRLTIQSVAKRRAASGRLLAGVAAAANVGTFKGLTHHLHKSKAKRWDDRLTEEAKARSGSSLKEAAKFLKQPGLISLGGGLPSSEYFPVVCDIDQIFVSLH